jgi:4-amino-4-deoxy-L-arabinose transferase-like glycosyltransferase
VTTHTPQSRWRLSSLALITLPWLVLQIGGLFSPGLLDDVDSVYIQIAREMLQRHDFVTPTIDGVRFFDKPPLMYWMAAGSMHLFGIHDWAARLPLALGVLALLFAVYALGIRLYPSATASPKPYPLNPVPCPSDRAGLYASLAMATSIGPYLYTRFFIPDILIALWMTLAVHLFLIALDRIKPTQDPSNSTEAPNNFFISTEAPTQNAVISTEHPPNLVISTEAQRSGETCIPFPTQNAVISTGGAHLRRSGETPVLALPPYLQRSPLLPMLAFGAVLALSVLTKGLIGIVFPILFVLLYLALTRNLRALLKLHIPAATAAFLAIAAPWHILAALRNPAIAMPSGVGLPARAGWAWFYLYNEHVARFLGKRIPHDYGQVPIPIFWLLLLLWLLPWVAFLPAALRNAARSLRKKKIPTNPVISTEQPRNLVISTELPRNLVISTGAQRSGETCIPAPPQNAVISTEGAHLRRSGETPVFFVLATAPDRTREAALALLLWAGIILGFFTLSSRQEYYHLPALPALALLVGGLLAAADTHTHARLQALRGALYLLVPLGSLLFLLCGYFAIAAPTPHPGATLTDLLTSNPENYNLSLGHLYDLTGAAMGFFRGPLLTVALGMLTLGPIAYIVRRRNHPLAANLLIAAAMSAVLLAAHEGLVRFYPTLGSKDLALAIKADGQSTPDLQHAPVLIDGELTAGSSLLFYLDNPVLLVNGHINGPWFGSFWPDAPPIFLDDADLFRQWHTRPAVYLLTYHPDQRVPELCKVGPVIQVATSGGKTVLRNTPTPTGNNLCTVDIKKPLETHLKAPNSQLKNAPSH